MKWEDHVHVKKSGDDFNCYAFTRRTQRTSADGVQFTVPLLTTVSLPC